MALLPAPEAPHRYNGEDAPYPHRHHRRAARSRAGPPRRRYGPFGRARRQPATRAWPRSATRWRTGATSPSNRRKPGRKAIRTPSTCRRSPPPASALATRVDEALARRTLAAGAGRRSLRRGRHGERRFPSLPRTRRKRRPDLARRARRHEHAGDQPQRQRPRHAAGLHRGRGPRGTGRTCAATARRSTRAMP